MYDIWNFDDDRKLFKLQHDSYADCRFICDQFIKLTSNEFIELELKCSHSYINTLCPFNQKYKMTIVSFQFNSTMGVNARNVTPHP